MRSRCFGGFGLVLSLLCLCLGVLVTNAEIQHGHSHHDHLAQPHRSLHKHLQVRNTTDESPEDIVTAALGAIAERNKARLEHPKFNKPQVARRSKQPDYAPPLEITGGLKGARNRTLFNHRVSNSTSGSSSARNSTEYPASAYTVPEDVAKAAKVIAESTPQKSSQKHREFGAHSKERYRKPSNATNAPEPLTPPEGKLSAWAPQYVMNGSQSEKRDYGYWMADMTQRGQAPYVSSEYKVWRNVKDYGAVGDGVTDDTDAINLAISDGGRCGPNCGSSSIHPAVVYFPPGTYLVSTSIIQYYNTQFLGDPHDTPVILAATSFVGLGVITSDVYISDDEQWYLNTSNFMRSIKNFIIDITQTDPYAYVCAIHWQVAQATSLENIQFYMASNEDIPGNTQQGIYMENGSGGWLSQLFFYGGNFGAYFGNQQFTTSDLYFYYCNTAVQVHWDWAWTMHEFIIDTCNTGLTVVGGAGGPQSTGQSVGSLILVDSVFLNTPNGIVTTLLAENSTSFLLQNVAFVGVTVPIQDNAQGTVLLSGPDAYAESWGFGKINDATGASSFVNGANIPTMTRSPELLGWKYPDIERSFFTRRRPTYYDEPISRIMDVKALGAVGDGYTDDTAALNSIFEGAANTSSIVFIPYGQYLITSTLHIPVGSRIIGQAWSQLQAIGPYFEDEANPRVAVQVGKPGDVGIVEIQDLIFTTWGPTAGLIMVQWNVQESFKGSAGMWDSHVIIGGAIGSGLQVEECPKQTSGIDPWCKSAALLMHLAPGSSAYLENIWLWTADHDLDKFTQDQIDVYAGRGILIESDHAWLWGTAAEHCVLYQYQLSGAENIMLSMIQTESPYFQPVPNAPQPFLTGIFPNDPDFSDCTNSFCAFAWAVRIIDSSAIYMLGAGLYSWFSDYDQTCLASSCQQRGFEVQQSVDIWIYNLCTKAIQEMISPHNSVPTLAQDNANGFLSSILAWLQGSNDVSGPRDFEGFKIYTQAEINDMVTQFPDACRAALTQTVYCDPFVANFTTLMYNGALYNDTLTDSVCDVGCHASLQDWFDNVKLNCDDEGYTLENDAWPTLLGGRMLQGRDETCLKDSVTQKYCNDIIADFTTVDSMLDMSDAEICSECYIERHRMMQQSSYSMYGVSYQYRLEYIYSRCGISGDISLPPIPFTEPEQTFVCLSGNVHTSVAGDTCDSLALANSFSSANLFMGNVDKVPDCDAIPAGRELCFPLPCGVIYTLQENDTCSTIDEAHNLPAGAAQQYNSWIKNDCSNLHRDSNNAYGHVLCLSPQNGVSDSTVPDSASVPTSWPENIGYSWDWTAPPDGATVAPGTTSRCGKYYTAQDGDLCVIITAKGPLTIDLLMDVNPSLGTNAASCDANVVPGQTYCVRPMVRWYEEPEEDPDEPTTVHGISSTWVISATVSPTSTPTPTPTPATYYGCYWEADAGPALISDSFTDPAGMTVEACDQYCTSRGYALFGLTNGDACHCGDALEPGAIATWESWCTLPCTGDATQLCGDTQFFSLHGHVAGPPDIVIPPVWGAPNVRNVRYVGCFSVPAPDPAMDYYHTGPWDDMSVLGCAYECLWGGETMQFGMEEGVHCYCDDSLHPGAQQVADAECDASCSGRPDDFCGATDRISVWEWFL